MTKLTGHARLQEPFPASQIQQLPQGGVKLDYVSHGNVTKRLLEVDPEWNWEPVAFDDRGLPLFDERGGLWIKLTVLGITRYGYGEPQGRDDYDKIKGSIGNALRNAGLRFGIALDLWARETPSGEVAPPTRSTKVPTIGNNGKVQQDMATDKQTGLIKAMVNGDLSVVNDWKESRGIDRNLTKLEATELIDWLKENGYKAIARGGISATNPEPEPQLDAWGLPIG